jgi:hypothetical protein
MAELYHPESKTLAVFEQQTGGRRRVLQRETRHLRRSMLDALATWIEQAIHTP